MVERTPTREGVPHTDTKALTSLTETLQPPPSAPVAAYFQGTWEELAGSGIAPREVTEGRAEPAQVEEFLEGCRLLRLGLPRQGLKPQQLATVDALSADRRYAAVLEPRRSSKTTTLAAWALGRCASRDNYAVGYYAGTSGKAARDQFLKYVIPKLEALYPDPATRPFRIRKGAGQERIEFTNGSLYQVTATPDDFRGATFDLIIVDEAGELDGEKFIDLLAAASPTQDTTPEPVMVFTGTAGRSREGNALWDFLERGRNGDPDVAIIEYSAGRDLTPADFETWELAAPLVETSHPGVGTLTTLDAIRNNYSTMPLENFGREYLGIFTHAQGQGLALHPAKWSEAELDEDFPEKRPDGARFAWGLAVHRSGTCASVAAAWRDDDGVSYVATVAWQHRTDWLPQYVADLTKDHPNIPISHDSNKTALVEIDRIRKLAPRSTVVPVSWSEVQQAAALFQRELERGKLLHYGQRELNAAASTAVVRSSGQGWAFGDAKGDVTALEAAALALHTLENAPQKRTLPRMTLQA